MYNILSKKCRIWIFYYNLFSRYWVRGKSFFEF